LLQDSIAPLDAVKEIRMRGLMCGVELLPGDRRGRKVCAAAVRRGVLLRPLGDVVVVMPPLSVTEDEITLITEVLRAAIEEESS
jgi:adenosylmethionine-8-amino-7-oxononanoate aminotransferase